LEEKEKEIVQCGSVEMKMIGFEGREAERLSGVLGLHGSSWGVVPFMEI
jgi:hypothetical protein